MLPKCYTHVLDSLVTLGVKSLLPIEKTSKGERTVASFERIFFKQKNLGEYPYGLQVTGNAILIAIQKVQTTKGKDQFNYIS